MTDTGKPPIQRTRQEYEAIYAELARTVRDLQHMIEETQQSVDEQRHELDALVETLAEEQRGVLADSVASIERAQQMVDKQRERLAERERHLAALRSEIDRM